jgi:hypothetical protein
LSARSWLESRWCSTIFPIRRTSCSSISSRSAGGVDGLLNGLGLPLANGDGRAMGPPNEPRVGVLEAERTRPVARVTRGGPVPELGGSSQGGSDSSSTHATSAGTCSRCCIRVTPSRLRVTLTARLYRCHARCTIIAAWWCFDCSRHAQKIRPCSVASHSDDAPCAYLTRSLWAAECNLLQYLVSTP